MNRLVLKFPCAALPPGRRRSMTLDLVSSRLSEIRLTFVLVVLGRLRWVQFSIWVLKVPKS